MLVVSVIATNYCNFHFLCQWYSCIIMFFVFNLFSYVYFLRSFLIGKSNSSKSYAQRVPATAWSSGFICHFQWHFMKFNCMCVNRPQKIQNKITPSKSNYEYQWFCLEWFYSFKMFLITFLPINIYRYIYIYIYIYIYLCLYLYICISSLNHSVFIVFGRLKKFRLKKKDLESSSPNVFCLLFTIYFVQIKSFHNKSNSPRYKLKAFFFQIQHYLAFNLYTNDNFGVYGSRWRVCLTSF